jgi:hypothetical protein
MSITAKFARKYTAKTGKWAGKTVRVYLVSSKTDEELQQYEESQGEYLLHDEDTGKPLWKTTNLSLPSVVTLEWNYDGTRVYVEDKVSEQLEAQYQLAEKQARAAGLSVSLLHQALATHLGSNMFATSVTAQSAPVQAIVAQQPASPAINPKDLEQGPVAESETPFLEEEEETPSTSKKR